MVAECRFRDHIRKNGHCTIETNNGDDAEKPGQGHRYTDRHTKHHEAQQATNHQDCNKFVTHE